MAVPAPTAVTSPVDVLTVATNVLLLLQVPPASPLLAYVAVAPIQSGEVPVTVPVLPLAFTEMDWDTVVVPHEVVTA